MYMCMYMELLLGQWPFILPELYSDKKLSPSLHPVYFGLRPRLGIFVTCDIHGHRAVLLLV